MLSLNLSDLIGCTIMVFISILLTRDIDIHCLYEKQKYEKKQKTSNFMF